MSNVLTSERDTASDIALIQRALFEESHLSCWCSDVLTLCGIYESIETVNIVEDDWEPDCTDCAGMTHCLYCGCEVGVRECAICIRKRDEWMASQ